MTKALHIEQLSKRYQSGVQALNNISLDVEKGDFFGLLGPNGAGKSTTIGIVTSLVNKTSGIVSVFGHDIDTDLERAKQCIGLVPQEFNFNIFEKVENIVIQQAGYYGVPYNIAKKRAQKYLTQLGIWEKRRQIARSLSGGMKRRLMIARALMHEPELLILDEPTAGVDIELRRTMWAFLQNINQQGTTIILTTHYLEEAEQNCQHIAIIDRGTIIENTDTKTLLRKLHIEGFILDTEQNIPESIALPDFNFKVIDTKTLTVEVREDQSLNHLFELLNQQNIRIMSMRNKANRLEELFVELVQKNDH